MFPKTPPAKYRPSQFRSNKSSVRNRNRRSTLSPIIEEDAEESLEKTQGTEHNNTHTRDFEQKYSLEEAVRDGSVNWVESAFSSVHNDDHSVETWDVLMNYMALEGAENLWKKRGMLKQVAYSPNGEGGRKAQQPTNNIWQESQGGQRPGRNDFGRGFPSKPSGYGENCNNSGGGGNPNPRFGNFGSGFKKGNDDTEGNTEQKEFDLRTKLRKEQNFGRMGATGPSEESHCFNCSRDGHFQASCPNPPFCYNCKKDGHRAMSCPAKKCLNLRMCGFGLPGQAFYSIQVPEDEGSNQMKTFPGILTVKEGSATEKIIDTELKYLFKGKSGWTIEQIGENEFILHFPSEELRHGLTKFKGFEFATAAVKAKVEPTEMEKEVVSILEVAWVKATGFPSKARRSEVIKEISHLVGDPIEVDAKCLQTEGAVRVKVYCMDASKVEGNTLVHINGQGHMIKWCSEKVEAARVKYTSPKISKLDRHRDDTGEEEDKDESAASHDTGFEQMAREQKEEEERRKNLNKAGGGKQMEELELLEGEDFNMSQTKQEENLNIPRVANKIEIVMDKAKARKEKAFQDAALDDYQYKGRSECVGTIN